MPKEFELMKRTEESNRSGREAELNDDIDTAIKHYEDSINGSYPDAFAFERLMIIYRKLKKFKDELRVIKKGIEVFAKQNQTQLKETLGKKKNMTQLKKLSDAFMKGSGLIDKKGNVVYYPEPINKWMKRKVLVEKKIKG